MKKLSLLALLLATLILLSSCKTSPAIYAYNTEDHVHVYVAEYDITPLSCTTEGLSVAYCKICRKATVKTTPIAEDIAARAHSFTDTVVPATESTEGYTVRQCRDCTYHIDRADVTPALYALLEISGMTTDTAPSGVEALLVSDTLSHVLSHKKLADTAVDGDLAVRLAIALTVTEELECKGGTLTPETPISVTVGALSGNTYTVRELLFELIRTGDVNVMLALAEALGEDSSSFPARIAARATRLGVASELSITPFDTNTPDTTTLHATAVLLLRALDTPLLAEAMTAAVPALIRVAGRAPMVYFAGADGTLRVTALKIGGSTVFALLYGSSLPADAESDIYL